MVYSLGKNVWKMFEYEAEEVEKVVLCQEKSNLCQKKSNLGVEKNNNHSLVLLCSKTAALEERNRPIQYERSYFSEVAKNNCVR
jgi:hypothetical protein